ncbi:MAG TPA: ABC transporter ATP-binding protein [Candidatus Omnitrophica bacterium]|uniref:ABC transporter related protein n=1 Tax=Candidatus Kaiserbacteria bacterium GW2011_GWA2_49_19 TaxID=1618669 RepID=A0A0G1VQZ7_9BACT|nr:MAG: ABC transporter related protein [Candidatus Kaiserbacteria bacterium GW2011_GWA2_49_19]OGX21730.1 MAG: ABC transporter ATP-binding protein [Omnitrophica WOR_2 bacterium GWC2_45_7]HBR15245.1 ABC transporter ATP-binding protein [Candidatus Omnitrophota bacterium]
MISTSGIGLQFGKRKLFEDVNITFNKGNCYGLIGANGSGKSTFLKILSGEIESTAGQVNVRTGERISILKQDQFAYDEYTVLTTVIMGHKKLYEIISEKDAIYAKPDFSDADGLRASELETEFADMNGWSAETDAAKLLSDLGIGEEFHGLKMKQLEASLKVRVLLAQALFGNPDVLLLDEPTNQLDVETCMWLEEFLCEFENTAIVVSHDRHFLDKVCTHVADIDFGKIQLYPGNYTYWYESSQLVLKQKRDANKKMEEKKKELEDFIARFSANASKSRQATSRKKILENLTIEAIKPSSRRYPYISFKSEREAGNDLLNIDQLSKSIEGKGMFRNLNIHVNKGDKIAFVGRNDLAKTTLFRVIMEELTADSGSFKWGASTTRAYFPKDNSDYFKVDLNLIDWLRQYSKEKDENFVRGFFGRMLFSGEEVFKSVGVLSGGEKVRCMLSRMMLTGANVLILDEPTNHLDLESITALNEGLIDCKGTVLFSSHDHQFVQTVANRIIEITPHGYIDRQGMTFDEYLSDEKIKKLRETLYQETQEPASHTP